MKSMHNARVLVLGAVIGLGAWSTVYGQAVSAVAIPGSQGQVSVTNYDEPYYQIGSNVRDSLATNGNLIVVEAIPVVGYPGYRLRNWSGAAFLPGGPLAGQGLEHYEVIPFYHNGSASYSMQANFGPPPTLTVTPNDPAFGKVSCSNTVDHVFTVPGDTAVDLSADAAETLRIDAFPTNGYFFSRWEGNIPVGAASNNPAYFPANGSNMNVTAVFVAVPWINVGVNDDTLGYVSIRNLTDGTRSIFTNSVRDNSANLGDQIEIVASNLVGGVFSGWTGNLAGHANNNPDGFGAPGTPMDITATFSPAPRITLMAGDPALGSVSISNKTDHLYYGPAPLAVDRSANNHDTVELRAWPIAGKVFLNWVGDIPPSRATANPAEFVTDGTDRNITANFGDRPQIVVSAVPAVRGNVTITNFTTGAVAGPDDLVNMFVTAGQQIIIEAKPDAPRYRFVRWTEGGSVIGTASPLIFTASSASRNIQAEFADPAYLVQASVLTPPGPGIGSGTVIATNETKGIGAGPGVSAIVGADGNDIITLIAVPEPTSPQSVFFRWYGDVPAGREGQNPLSFVAPPTAPSTNGLIANALFSKDGGVGGDIDGDGMSDSWEMANSNCLDVMTADDGSDPDLDALLSIEEFLGPVNGAPGGINPQLRFGQTRPCQAHSDGDNMNDGWEAYYGLDPLVATGNDGPGADVDGDGLSNYEEYLGVDGVAPVGDGLGTDSTDPQNFDTDGDQLGDGWEVFWGLDPQDTTDPNGTHHNPDDDFLPAVPGYVYPQSPLDPINGYLPSTRDAFDNLFEFVGFDLTWGTADDPGTDPSSPDSDLDGLFDGWEYYFYGNAINNTTNMVGRAYDPNTVTGSLPIAWTVVTNWFNPTLKNGSQAFDVDGDCLSNFEEMQLGTDPINWDTDGDGLPDGWEEQYSMNPLSPTDPQNIDDDWMADARNGGTNRAPFHTNVHFQVYLAYGFHPLTGWGPAARACGTGGQTNSARTRAFNAIDEFRLARWYQLMNTNIGPIGCSNWVEYTTDPTKVDTDGDGIADGWELYVNLDPSGPTAAADGSRDMDGDGLLNVGEFRCYNLQERYPSVFPVIIRNWLNKFWPTDPRDPDTDKDQLADGGEGSPTPFMWANGVSTLTGVCYPGGGLNPTGADTDGDFLPDYWEFCYPNGGGTNANGPDGTISDAHADYDADGLENYQEYWANAVYHFQYDPLIPPAWGPGRGFGGYDPMDFFYPPWGRQPHPWDCRYLASPCSYWGFITARRPPVRRGGIRVGGTFATLNPKDWDSDADGMDDFYEMYHGLNPLWGTLDLVHGPNVAASVPNRLDIRLYPWLNGSQAADSDQDGLPNGSEFIDPNVPDPQPYHTDPSPLWLTDHSYELSWVNLYYWLGGMYLNWWWDPGAGPIFFSMCGAAAPPAYVYSFEMNEGFDTDNDNVPDHDDLEGMDSQLGVTDPLDDELPIKRRALKLTGNAAARTRGVYYHNNLRLHNFTVEAWARPSAPRTGVDQVLLERPFMLPNNNPMGWTNGIRLNFRLAIDGNGLPYAEYNGAGFDPTTVDPRVRGTVPLQPNQWYHLAATYDGTIQKFKLYVNGSLANSVPSALIPVNGWFGGNPGWAYMGPIVIGARDRNPNGYVAGQIILVGRCAGLYPTCSVVPNEPRLDWFFRGWLDEIRVWDGARSEAQIRNAMRLRIKRLTAIQLIRSVPTLMYHYTFDDLPDPDHSPVAPQGFSALNGRPNDGSYPHVPWWAKARDVSQVYTERHYIPWIPNTVAHLALDPAADSPYWPIVLYDTNGLVTGTNVFPNSSNPYNMAFTTGPLQADGDHPDYVTNLRLVFNPSGSALFNDLLPLRFAEADEDVVMWDGLGYGTNVNYDTDGDGLPDLWELRYGLNPTSPTGDDGMNGDPDNDGLKNFAEWRAGTDPYDFDSDDNGFGDYDSTNRVSYGRTFGDLYTDNDGIDDAWEATYTAAMSPLLYDAQRDFDRDNWSNFAEFMADTAPDDITDFPVPLASFYVEYSGINRNGPLVIHGYTTPTMDGEPDVIYQSVQGSLFAVVGEIISVTAGPAMRGNFLQTRLLPGSVSITYTGGGFTDDGLGGLLGTLPGSAGTVNYLTGAWTLSWAIPPAPGLALSANYVFQNQQTTTYPTEITFTQPQTGVVREGSLWFFAFLDNDGDQSWTPGEPCGLAQGATRPATRLPHEPVMVGWDRFRTRLSLSDQLPGYARLGWPLVAGATDPRTVRVRRVNSPFQPTILNRVLEAPRNYLHEGDWRVLGQYGMDAGGLSNPLYQWLLDGVPSGYVTNSWPVTLAKPVLVAPNGGVLKYAESEFVWRMDSRTTLFELQISAASLPGYNIFSGRFVPPHRNASGEYRFPLPWLVGDAGLGNRAYIWRLRAINPARTSAWATATFRVDLQNTVQGAHSIGGAIFYFGRVEPPKIVVQAFTSAGFSGKPAAQLTLNRVGHGRKMTDYQVLGLRAGTYYVRAFIDQNGNKLLDSWESFGFVKDTASPFYTDYKPGQCTVPLNLTGRTIVIRDRDTDNDDIPDALEYATRGRITNEATPPANQAVGNLLQVE